MHKYFILLAIGLFLISCEETTHNPSQEFQIANLTTSNYPKVDGSTSTEPLQVLVACKLFNIDYAWVYTSFWYKYTFRLMPSSDQQPGIAKFITERIMHSGTHGSFVNLIHKHADIILVARTASEDELHLADSMGVELIESPVALDAFVFLNNNHNPVNSLSSQEIQGIYTDNIKNWSEVGGEDKEINPYQRNANSGSQELMESLVMKDLEMPDLPNMIMNGMMGLINAIEYDREGLGYSVNYYTDNMVRSDSIKKLSIDGVFPEKISIKNKSYPYTTTVYVVIRKDLEQSSNAYQLYDLLMDRCGQRVVGESGYVPYY